MYMVAAVQATEPDEQGETAQPVRVLIVDDSPAQRRLVSIIVRKWGFEVAEAASGREALDLCARFRPDIVLSDWMMPELNGLEFCKAFREIDREGYSYFILLTSKNEKAEVALGLDAGADDFLTKPVNGDELRARVQAGLRIVRMQRELSHKNDVITQTLEELQRLYDSLDSDLIEAKKLQQSLIPTRYRDDSQGQISLLLRQCGHVGGDLVGFFPAGPKHVGLYSIDVSGHGISSALMTARLAGYLSATAPDQNIALARAPCGTYAPRPPKDVLHDLNTLILGEMETELYFTMALGIVDASTGHLTVAQAGHPHPAVLRANGKVQLLGEGGFPIGLVPGIEYAQHETTLSRGDSLIFVSDGITECEDENGTQLGDDGLQRILGHMHSTRPKAFFEVLMWELEKFTNGASFSDDVSGVLYRLGQTTG